MTIREVLLSDVTVDPLAALRLADECRDLAEALEEAAALAADGVRLSCAQVRRIEHHTDERSVTVVRGSVLIDYVDPEPESDTFPAQDVL